MAGPAQTKRLVNHRKGAVVIAVIGMRVVEAPLDQIVHVIPVRNLRVPTARTMAMTFRVTFLDW